MRSTVAVSNGASIAMSLTSVSMTMPSPTSSLMVTSNSSSKPGRTRPSMAADASVGMTLCL